MTRYGAEALTLRSRLQLAGPPIAIAFHDRIPASPPRCTDPVPPPAPDGRTGRVAAGCVFWMRACEGGFTTTAEDHANCTVGSYTHGFVSLDAASARGDVTAIVEAGWVRPEDFAAIPSVAKAPAAVTYAPLADAEHVDVVLVRLHAAGLMTLLDAVPGLRIEGKPQCHIVAVARERDQVAASVGCALSRARTGMPPTEATAAIPISRLDDLLVSLDRVAEANAAVARYAGADAARFATT